MISRVLFLMGPTASGKTDLACGLVKRFNAELVSVDTAQVYRGMDIGTAKPEPEFLESCPHHLVDIRDPAETYSAAEFRLDALKLIGEILQRGKLPVFVGGSMFYFSALEHGLSSLPSSNPEVRAQIEREIDRDGLDSMHQQLSDIDPDIASEIRPSDSQRIQRAMEIHRLTGEKPSRLMAAVKGDPCPWPLVKIGLFTASRALLHDRIERRFVAMLEQGLVDEVKTLMAAGHHPDRQPSMRSVGYRQVVAHLDGECSHEEMTQRGIAATRQLAKRQLTWMRQQSNLVWVDRSHPGAIQGANRYLEGLLGR